MRLGTYTPTSRDATVTLRGRPLRLAAVFGVPWIVGLAAIVWLLVRLAMGLA